MKSPLAFLVPLIALLILSSASLYSLPRLATEHAEACKTCHVNPNGGGARTEYGNHSVAFNELCLPQTKKLVEKKFRKPRLSESLLIGFDTRHLILESGRIFRMQTDVYVTVEPIEDFFYSFRFWEDGINENYALLYFDKQKYYLKLGRFAPAYGLRIADHKTYVRENLGFGSNFYLDGISIGAELKGINLVGEIFNPNERMVGSLHIFRPGFLDPISYLLGISLRMSETVNGSNGAFPHTRALFGGLSYNRFTLMGEIDLAGKSNDSLLTYIGLTSRIEYGLYLIAEYNYFDPNLNSKSGTEENLRLSLELYPFPFFQLRPSYTYYTGGPLKGEDNFFLMVHFGY